MPGEKLLTLFHAKNMWKVLAWQKLCSFFEIVPINLDALGLNKSDTKVLSPELVLHSKTNNETHAATAFENMKRKQKSYGPRN